MEFTHQLYFSFHFIHSMYQGERETKEDKYLLLITKNKRLSCLAGTRNTWKFERIGEGCPKGNKSGWPAPWEGDTCPTCSKPQQPALPPPADPPISLSSVHTASFPPSVPLSPLPLCLCYPFSDPS